MSTWIIFAVMAPAVYAAVNFIDKYILEREVQDYYGMPVYAGIVAAMAGLIVQAISPIPYASDVVVVLVSGILQIFGTALYFRAISKSETSIIIILFQMLPIFVLLFSFLFLGEIITKTQLVGFVLILVASIATSLDLSNKKFTIDEAFFIVLIVDILWAASAVLMKFASTTLTFRQIVAYESWGIAIGALILYLLFERVREGFATTQKHIRLSFLPYLLGNEVLYLLAKALAFYAYVLGPVALVSVVGSAQVFFGILYGSALTLIHPKIFKEDVSTKAIAYKFLLALIMCLGIWLVY